MLRSVRTSRSAARYITLAHLTSLMEHPAFPQRPRQDMVEGVAPVGDVFMGVDEDVGWNVKSRQGMVEPDQLLVAAPSRPERFGFHHDQIDIRTLVLVAARARAEQDDLFRIDLVDDGLDHAVQKCIGRRLPAGSWLHSTSPSSFSSPAVISRSIASTSRTSSAGSSSGTASATRGLYREAVRL